MDMFDLSPVLRGAVQAAVNAHLRCEDYAGAMSTAATGVHIGFISHTEGKMELLFIKVVSYMREHNHRN